MPKLYLPVPEVDKAIVRPALIEIVRQVKDITGLPEDARVMYLSETNSSPQAGSTVDTDIMDNTTITGSKLITIEVNETYNENYLGTVAIAQMEHVLIFNDPFIGVNMKPIYTSRTYEITVRYRNPSRTQAKAWRDHIYMHTNHLRDVNLHKATYHYSIPKPFMRILKEIHTLRENVAPYGDTFTDWLLKHVTSRITAATTLNGDKAEWVIPEQQIRVQGIMNWNNGAPERESQGGDTNLWFSEFTYTVTIDVPTGIHIEYPIMVHNQLLDMKFIPEEPPDDETQPKTFPFSLKALHHFEVGHDTYIRQRYPMRPRWPEYDDWWPTKNLPDMRCVFSALCDLDPNNKSFLLNLEELGDYAIKESIMKFIREVEWKYITKPYKSMLYLTYYRSDLPFDDRWITLDNKMNLRAKNELSLRDMHRVTLNLVIDPSVIDPKFFDRINKYPDAKEDLGIKDRYKDRPIFYTVNTAYIIARRRSDYNWWKQWDKVHKPEEIKV